MTTGFEYEVASAVDAFTRARPELASDPYALPWYLVLGEPGTGRTTALKSQALTWPHGDGPVVLGLPRERCAWWLSGEAVFIEPGREVVGPDRTRGALTALTSELALQRPREPVDGIVLVVNLAELLDRDEASLLAYAGELRRGLVEAGQGFQRDVPVYIVVTRYDTLWGFADVFRWTPDRKNEDPWGFIVPRATPTPEVIQRELAGLLARVEAFSLAKIASDDPPDVRARGFQHLVEARAMFDKLRQVLVALSMSSAYERAPWIRALVLGSALPGTGDRIRAGVARFANMGLVVQEAMLARAPRPGGMPIHAFCREIVLPDSDLVPTRVRFRDDVFIRAGVVVAAALFAIAAVIAIVRTLV